MNNREPRFEVGSVNGAPVIITALEPGVAFDLVHLKLTAPYQQKDASGFPPRPSGAPRTIKAGERCSFFRCEALALQAAGAAGVLERHVHLYALDADARRVVLPLGDLVDFLMAEVRAPVNAALSDVEAVAQ